MTIYKVLLAEHYATWIKVEANSEKEPLDKAEKGDWSETIETDLLDRMVVGDVSLHED